MESNPSPEKMWSERYREGVTPWDIGYVATPLKAYFDQLSCKEIKILIPGAGNAYEAEYLHKLGFRNVYIVDISPLPLQNFKTRVPDFPSEHILLADFFDLSMCFELIVEQTFFCALHPSLRNKYVNKMHHLLGEEGKLIGLLFTFPLSEDGPPYGGSKKEYMRLFSSRFTIEVMEPSYNSIPPRNGTELFINLVKK